MFGGSFDPVHNAHLALGRQATQQLALDELCWVPAGQPWQKPRAVTAGEHRLAMLALAVGGVPHQRIEDCELQRTGPSYTLDTVRELQARQPDTQWFLVIGQDQYCGLHSWQGFGELLQRVTLAVALRPGASSSADPRVRAAPRVELSLPAMSISSSEIRARVAGGQDIGALVPRAVAQYIYQHRLYTSPPGVGNSAAAPRGG